MRPPGAPYPPGPGLPGPPGGSFPVSPPGSAPPPAPAKSRRALVLTLVAVGAVLLALCATGVAAYEAGRASQRTAAPSGGNATTPGQVPPAAATGQGGQPPATTGVTPTPNAIPSDINPSAQFTPAYQLQQELQLRPGGACPTLYVDLDEPRVNVGSDTADFSLYSCSDRQEFSFSTSNPATASITTNPNSTPNECAESIRTSALADGAKVPVQKDVIMCVATSRTAALDKGITRKIALVVVKAVAVDGTVTLLVSAWKVPG